MDPLGVVRAATAQRLAIEQAAEETVRAAAAQRLATGQAAERQIRSAHKQWQAAIRQALAAGALPREVAQAAGVTRQRVVQIAQSAGAGI